MDPMTMMLINLGMSAGQSVYGAIQEGKARKELKNLKAPEYQVQPEAYKALGIAQSLASDRTMPGQQDMIEAIDRGIGNAVTDINRSGGSAADRMAAISAAYAEGSNQKGAIGIQAQQQYLNNLSNLQNAYGQMVSEKDKVFANQQQNYMQKVQSLQAMAGAGVQNIAGGIQSGVGAFQQYGGYQAQMDAQKSAHDQKMAELMLQVGQGPK
jgi:hypothetical protein